MNICSIIAILIILIIIFSIYIDKDNHSERNNFRYKSLYTKGFYDNLLKTQNDEPFHVIETFNINPNIDNVFSTSIYGSNPKYFNGISRIIKDIQNYPGWKLRIHAHENIPLEYKNNLINDKSIETYIIRDSMIQPGNSAGMFWRFLPLSENVNFVSVDIDDPRGISYFGINNGRIKEWLNADKGFVKFLQPIPYPWSKSHLSGGAWGKKKHITIPQDIITHYPIRHQFGSDELFLHKVISPIVEKEGIMTVSNFLNKMIYKYLQTNNSQISHYNKDNEMLV